MPSLSPSHNVRKSSRDLYWDAVKALLIFLVIAGHVVQYYLVGDSWQNPLFKGIYLFHMPLFILLSGYFSTSCMQPASWLRLPSQLRHLGFPILTVILIQLAILGYRSYAAGVTPSWEQCLACVRGLWFLWVLLECWIAAMLIFAIPSRLLRIIPCIGLMFLGDWLPYGTYFISLWPFFLLGLLLHQRGFQSSSIRAYWLLALPLSVLAFFVYRSEWSLYYASTHWDAQTLEYFFLRSAISLVCCMGFLTVCHYLQGIIKNRFVVSVGRSTMGIYVLQTYLFYSGMGRGFFYSLGIENQSVWAVLLLSVALLLIFYAAYLLLCRVRIVRLFLFGEK